MPLWLLGLGSSAFGFLKSIPLKVWLIIAAVIIALIVLWRIESAVSSYYKYVHSIEQQNKALVQANGELNREVNDLADLNKKNQDTYNESLRQSDAARQIADQERVAAEARATQYRSIRDAIKSTPTSDRHPVSHVVLDTVDRLWDDKQPAPGNPSSHP